MQVAQFYCLIKLLSVSIKNMKILKKITSLSLIMMLMVLTSGVVNVNKALAASMTASKDTATRLKISTTADHTIVTTLPTGVDFDSTGNTDMLRFDFASTFSTSGTWVTGDFTFNDGTARTVQAVAQGAGTVDCTVSAGVNNVCVAIDTTGFAFYVKPSATYTASATAATITFTIDGTTTDGTLTNPASAGSAALDLAACDEVASCTTSFTSSHTAATALGIADDDQVTVTATVNSSLTFDLDANTSGTGDTVAPYTVALGTITTVDTRVSGATDSVNRIMMDLDTNAASGVVVTVKDANGTNGLVSTSVPADNINSADGTMADGTENYGLCVISVTQTLGTLSKASPYNSGTCAADSETNDIQALTTSGENIVSSAAPISGGRAQIAVNAAISGITPAHSDYTDTLTFIATSTF